ncbi:hypothetical protein MCOR25_003515 [Pyricularia grisea]|nr:hypothetical protein MCOR25_003515 [Pyricularia grisea]
MSGLVFHWHSRLAYIAPSTWHHCVVQPPLARGIACIASRQVLFKELHGKSARFSTKMAPRNVLIYLFRKDLRVSDNPILHTLATQKDHGFTHLLPVYIFPSNHVEISGFISDKSEKSPYPEARSKVSGYWRCGPYRAKFISQAVWDVKKSLEKINSGLLLRLGSFQDVVEGLLDGLKARGDACSVWMVGEEGLEEIQDEISVSNVCKTRGFDFKKLVDEKYFIDDRDLNFAEPQELPGIFTDYRKSVEPLRERPRKSLPTPETDSLPPFPEPDTIAEQARPFSVPDNYEDLETALLKPVKDFSGGPFPEHAENATTAHPFKGGETPGQERLQYVMSSGIIKDYKTSRNGLIGPDFSTKLSAYLAQGCITARQIHESLLGYEDGTATELKEIEGFGQGENINTKSVREELMWRDYMRLYARKIKEKLYSVEGPRGGRNYDTSSGGEVADGGSPPIAKKVIWKTPDPATADPRQTPEPEKIKVCLDRFLAGTTGLGLIDASMRELLHTGYTSNRARQNAANFLAKHLGIDWRWGAEWYEMLLVDYDVCSNWANWQYVAGVGNDPRGEARIFNPVKQAFDYDKEGAYVKMWVPELAPFGNKLELVFQACKATPQERDEAGLSDNIMVTDPVKRIAFNPNGKPPSKRPWKKKESSSGNTAGGGGGSPNEGSPRTESHGGSQGKGDGLQQSRGGRQQWRGGSQGYPPQMGRAQPGNGTGYRGYHHVAYGGSGPQGGRGGWQRRPAGPGRGGGSQGFNYRNQGGGGGYYSGRGGYPPQPYEGGSPNYGAIQGGGQHPIPHYGPGGGGSPQSQQWTPPTQRQQPQQQQQQSNA